LSHTFEERLRGKDSLLCGLVQPRSVSVCVSSEDWVVRRAASFFDWSSFGDSRNWRVDTFIQRSRELLVERKSCPCRRHLTERYAGRTITTPPPEITYPAMYPSGLPSFIPPATVANRVPGQLNTQTTGFGGTAGSIEIFYEFVVDDPATYTQPWKAQLAFRPQSRRQQQKIRGRRCRFAITTRSRFALARVRSRSCPYSLQGAAPCS